MKRLFVFPEVPGSKSGYQIAVASDMSRLKLRSTDHVFFYTTVKSDDGTYAMIPKKSRWSMSRIKNLLQCRVSSELDYKDLQLKVDPKVNYDVCFCGDVIVYKALKKLYPQAKFYVRFHNLFMLSWERNKTYRYTLGLLAYLNIRLLSLLEEQIFRDPLVYPIFISREEASYFQRLFPLRKFKVWEIFKEVKQSHTLLFPSALRLVWFGGVSSHKRFGLEYFIKEVYIPLFKKNNRIELHLFGSGTLPYHNPSHNIHGYGFYKSSNLPFEGDALFVNPDLLGGGIKLKIKSWLESGVSFISTAYGMEGYHYQEKPNIIVAEIGEWEEKIVNFFKERTIL